MGDIHLFDAFEAKFSNEASKKCFSQYRLTFSTRFYTASSISDSRVFVIFARKHCKRAKNNHAGSRGGVASEDQGVKAELGFHFVGGPAG